jgi:nucleoside-diphosphate-sugar epimerase
MSTNHLDLHRDSSDLAALHVILGAGQIAQLLADELLATGHRVRLVRRGEPGPERANLTWMRGDLSDLAFAEEATRGAAVVYQCSAPPYDQWLQLMPALWRGGLHGAAKAGARYVVLDNLYMYGAVGSAPFDENTPVRPISRKGELRARLAEEILAAHRRGDVRATIGRAGDFIGPGATIAIVFHEDFYRRALVDEPAQVPGDPDQPHSFSFTPDVAAALATLGAREEALGKVWHLPVLRTETTRATVARVQRALGAAPRLEAVSDATLAAVGEHDSVIREIVEMTYLYKSPCIVDDTRFRTAFGQNATPIDVAVDATARWARERFAPAPALT